VAKKRDPLLSIRVKRIALFSHIFRKENFKMAIKKNKINKMISRKEFNKKKYDKMAAMQDADNSRNALF